MTPPRGTVVLWSLQVPEPERAESWHAVLCAEERARADRFRFAPDRAAYVTAHALLRALLAAQGVARPAFAVGPWGRPELADPGPGLRFSLTHTRALVAVGLTSRDDVGVDAESAERDLDTVGLATRFFAPREAEALRSLPPSARPDAFCRLWTLKEAFVKAVGRGLSLPLDAFAFGPGPDDFAPPADLGTPDGWSFVTRPTEPPGYVSVALRAPRRPGIRLEHLRLAPCDLDARLGDAGGGRHPPALTAERRRGRLAADVQEATTP